MTHGDLRSFERIRARLRGIRRRKENKVIRKAHLDEIVMKRISTWRLAGFISSLALVATGNLAFGQAGGAGSASDGGVSQVIEAGPRSQKGAGGAVDPAVGRQGSANSGKSTDPLAGGDGVHASKGSGQSEQLTERKQTKAGEKPKSQDRNESTKPPEEARESTSGTTSP